MKSGIWNINRKAIFPPLLIAVLLIGVLLTGKGNRGHSLDFRAGRWGDAPNIIQERESSAGFTPAGEMQQEEDDLVLLFKDLSIMNYQCDVAYRFSSSEHPLLHAGEYRFHGLTHTQVTQLTVTLESKYGLASERSGSRQVYEVARSRITFDPERSLLIHTQK